MANSTADTPNVSEAELANMTIDQLRDHARMLGIDGADELHKPELLAEVKDQHYAQAHGGRDPVGNEQRRRGHRRRERERHERGHRSRDEGGEHRLER